MTETPSPVGYELVDQVALVRVQRPQAMNALDRATLEGLAAAFDRAFGEAQVIVLTGAGEKAFVAGADIAAMSAMTESEASAFSDYGSTVFRSLEKGPLPTIAAVNGFALGGGCELAMACDILYASPRARFGQPEVNLGLIPGFGGTQRLALRVGHAMALELLMTGRMIDAQEALRIGLVNRVVGSDESVVDVAMATAREIVSRGPLAVRATRQLTRRMMNQALDEALRAESREFGTMFGTEDGKEGMGAFLAKRAASFTGR